MTFQPQFNKRSLLTSRSLSPSLSLTLFLRVLSVTPFYFSLSNLFWFVWSFRIWNWLVKSRQVFTEEFCHSRLISFYLLSQLPVSLHVQDMSCLCVCVSFIQLYACDTISLSLHGYIWHMLNGEPGVLLVASYACVGVWVCVPERQSVLMYQSNEVVWKWQLHYPVWKRDKWSLQHCKSKYGENKTLTYACIHTHMHTCTHTISFLTSFLT